MGFFFNSGFFEICFMTVFLLVIAVFVVNAVRAVTQWNKNNHSPVLTVDAKVVSRRADIIHPRPQAIMLRSKWRAETGWNFI